MDIGQLAGLISRCEVISAQLNSPDMGRLICGVVLSMLSMQATPAVADCPTPMEFSKTLLKDKYSFQLEQKIPEFIAPEFRKLIEADHECERKEQGVCRLDWDPWISAQDGEMGKPVTLTYEFKRNDEAVVAVKYPFVLGDDRPVPQVVHLVYQKKQGACWTLEDFIEPAGQSMFRVFSEPMP
jgi:hypothetical protein